MTRANAVTTWLSRLVAVVATLAAAGWVLGVEPLINVGPGRATMQLSTAGRGITDGGRRSGMNNVESRARELGGEARWERATPQGTVLTFCVPLRGPAG